MHRVADFLCELSSSLQVLKIYTQDHPKSKQAIELLYKKLDSILRDEEEIVIGIVGNEFAFKNEIFFDLSQRLKDFMLDLIGKGVEKILFIDGVTEEELALFLKSLFVKKDEFGDDFISYFNKLNLEFISLDKIKIGSKGKKEEMHKQSAEDVAYEGALGTVSDSFKGILSSDFIDFYDTKVAMKNMLKQLLLGRFDFLNFTSVKTYDQSTFSHSLNVSILSMFFSSKLGFKKEDILELGMAGLFHDMGKIAISRSVIQKPSALSDEEFISVKSHTILGAEILAKYSDSLGYLPMLAALEHHLKYNLKGYPQLKYPRKPSFPSLIISLCDCYDALRSRRSYKSAYSPEMIFDLMKRERGEGFDPHLFDEFFKVIGVYPIATIVRLNDDSVGIVTEQNESNIYRPKIRILSPDSEKDKIVDLVSQPDSSIKESLNPLNEGKKYIPLV